MTKVLILYYSRYGHIAQMAQAAADGARSAGATVDVMRVPEIVETDHVAVDIDIPFASPDQLDAYDAIIIGTGTRYGRLSGQMAAFLDQTGSLWARGALNGKVGGAFTSTASQHGGHELSVISLIVNMLHLGLTIVGLPYSYQDQLRLDEVLGGSPYGAGTIAGGDGARQPSAIDLGGAHFQGKLIAETAAKLFA